MSIDWVNHSSPASDAESGAERKEVKTLSPNERTDRLPFFYYYSTGTADIQGGRR